MRWHGRLAHDRFTGGPCHLFQWQGKSIVRNIVALTGTMTTTQRRVTSASRVRAWTGAIARHERLIFSLLILVHLIPIWAFQYLPTTDGAAHVANAQVMRKIHDPSLPVFQKYYFVSGRPSPN